MDKKVTLGCIAFVLSMIGIGFSMYVSYRILEAVNADGLMWFLFWANLPITIALKILVDLVAKVIE